MSKVTIRVAIIAGHLGLGGAERQLYYLVRGLECSRFEPMVVTLNPGKGDHWEERIRAVGIPVLEMPRANHVLRAWRIRCAIQRWQANVVHGFHFFLNGYGVLATWLRSQPMIGGIRFLPTRGRLEAVPFPLWRRMCLYGVDRLVCNSHLAKETLLRTYPNLPQVDVIPNGVPYLSDREVNLLRHHGRAKLGGADGELVVGFVGALNENKNTLLLLQAASQLVSDFPRLRVVVVGDGALRSQLETETRHSGLNDVVTFLGQRPSAERLMPAFDVLCLTSNSEGMPNVLMEAAVAGVPVIATNVGGVSEVVRDCETGFLFPSGDITALMTLLRLLLSDVGLRQRMGLEGRALMKRCFSLEQMVRKYERLYIELAKTNLTNAAVEAEAGLLRNKVD